MSAFFLIIAILLSAGIIGTFLGVALTCITHPPSTKKLGAVIASICLMICALTAGFAFIVIGFSEESVSQSSVVESIELPSAMVEIIMTNGVLTEARIVETVGDAVGLRSYTNVQWNKSEGLSKLEIRDETIIRTCGCIELGKYERKLAVFS